MMTYFGELFGRFSDKDIVSRKRARDGRTQPCKAGAYDGDVKW
jgi:hypothetical protein